MKQRKFSDTIAVFIVFASLLLLNLTALRLIPVFTERGDKTVLGGVLIDEPKDEPESIKRDYIMPDDVYIERFLRPSNLKALDKKYYYSDEAHLPDAFLKPSEVIFAYFDILSDASNIGNKNGGCGSIGFEKAPYPEAYKLLSQSFKKYMTSEKFIKSFEGIGHINLLKLIDVPAVKIKDTVYPRYLVEIETIEGSDTPGKTYFAYYYGYITVVKEGESGWKIDDIELIPEDFLCHAYHGWWHDAETLVDAIYIKKLKIADKILGVEEDGYLRNVFAKANDGKQYRFSFIRLTNGADVEIRQYVLSDGKWVEIKIER